MAFPSIQTAAAHLEREQTGEAIPLLERLVDDFPAYSTAYLLLARAHRMEGHRTEALRALAQVQLWSSGSSAVQEELRALIDEQFAPAGGSSDEAGGGSSPVERPASSSTVREASLDRAAPPAGHRPEDLAEDLRERLGPPSETADEDIRDLDSLIRRLEGARIQPEPEFGSADRVDDEDEDEGEDEVISETLARIYAAQKEYKAAVETYRQLAQQYPERADEFLEQARVLENKLSP